jgi:hypothetical protein
LSFKNLVVVEGLHFSAAELDQGLLKLGSLGCGRVDAVGELDAACFSLNSRSLKLRSFSSSRAISSLSCCERFSDSAILLSTSGSRRQLSNCFAEACGYESHNRQRGKDAPDAPLLVEGEAPGPEGDVVTGGNQSNQANHQAAQELNPGGSVESEETELSMHQVWRNRGDLAGQRR